MKQITLTLALVFATLTMCAQPMTKTQLNDYAQKLELGISYATTHITLPSSSNDEVTIKWASSHKNILSESGQVKRPAIGNGDQLVVLTATLKAGKHTQKRQFAVTVPEADYGYLMSYTLTGNTTRTSCFFIGNSEDGNSFTSLNNNKALVYPLVGTKKMRQPFLFRKADGSFGLIGTDNNENGIMVYHSADLIDYEQETYLKLAPRGTKIVDVRCDYDNATQHYSIKWRRADGVCYESLTKDFKYTLQPKPTASFERPSMAEDVAPAGTQDHSLIALTRAEYTRVCNKYAKVTNTGIAPLEAITVSKGTSPTLPNRVTAQYSDGSTKQMGVKWNEAALKGLDLNKAGKYSVTGTIQQPEYSAPLIRERADPWVFLGDDNYYYFTGTYPMHSHNDKNGYDRVILRRAKTIEGLGSAEEITIWHEKECPDCFRYVWAPEIHQIEGTWFVFFTTGTTDNVWSIRPRIIVCNKGDKDPYNPNNWEEIGHEMIPVAGDNHSTQHFSLDMTHFTSKGKHYVAWAEKPGTSDILIAEVDGKEPWKMLSHYTLLTKPEYAWEHDGNTWVNEGPAVIKHNGKIYMAYSASAVNHTYCVGYVYADEDADLLDANSWTKLRYPILSTEDLPTGLNGPGHNSFTVDEYGNPVIVYHARNLEDTTDGGLWDPSRHEFVRSVNFAADGMPILNMTREQELNPAYRTVTIEVIVK